MAGYSSNNLLPTPQTNITDLRFKISEKDKAGLYFKVTNLVNVLNFEHSFDGGQTWISEGAISAGYKLPAGAGEFFGPLGRITGGGDADEIWISKAT